MLREQAERQTAPLYVCPCCLNPVRGSVFTVANLPWSTFPLSGVECPVTKLEVAFCSVCGHYFQPDIDNNKLEFIYRHIYAESPWMAGDYASEIYRRPFMELFQRQPGAGPDAALLEIGCGDPEHLRPFARMGYRCFGIDPSPMASSPDLGEKISIIKGYLEESTFNQPVDVIILRSCLEHLGKLSSILRRCHSLLKPGGLIYLQVPNNGFTLTHRPPLFASHEHLHYFTRQSLGCLLSRNGFEPVEDNGDAEPSLISCWAKGPDWTAKNAFFWERENLIESQLHTFLAEWSRPVFYGYGMAFNWLLAKIDLRKYDFLIADDTSTFHGKTAPGTAVAVLPLSKCRTEEPGRAVLICASVMYHNQMLAKVRNQLPQTPVFGITSEGIVPLWEKK
ncbi:hypothetical protein C4J81_18600 (plasmid) [Deltaproteobacteria bacterium Smac51]|nr:hypothetical protein C4J81_18600 [Deltaproteobacteria bacterium Smac51]